MSALRRALAAFAGLAVAFMAVSAVVALGDAGTTDRQVAATMQALWRPAARWPAWAVAILGGVELTGLTAAGLAAYLYRLRFRAEAWAVLALPLATLVEAVYKRLVYHPAPSGSMVHGDGPSITQLLPGLPGNSFPSGHMTRTVLVYGLLAFVIFRMAERWWVRRLAVAAALAVGLLMAADRLYLGVHWESDVLGGALLGSLALAGAIIWLDRPRGLPRE